MRQTRKRNLSKPRPARRLRWTPQWDDVVAVGVDVLALDSSWQRDSDYVQPQGFNGLGDRYAEFGEWLSKATEPIWMPTISYSEATDWHVAFTDGRHRFAWLRDHGVKTLPVATDPGEVVNLKERFGTSSRVSWLPRFRTGITSA